MGIAAGTVGVSFGALATAAGLSVIQTCAMSVLVFTGGSQFALVGVLGGGSPLSGAASAVLLGSRNALYGARLAPLLQLSGLRRVLGAQLVIDETTAVALGSEERGERAGRLGFWATGLTALVVWNGTTLVGALAGRAIGDPRAFGLDAAVAVAFLALLVPRLRSRPARLTAAAAAVVALGTVSVVPAGVPVLLAALVPVVAVLVSRRLS
ncbi:MAG: AzlC family ABC transporter permease [Actinomycetes bacterium]